MGGKRQPKVLIPIWPRRLPKTTANTGFCPALSHYVPPSLPRKQALFDNGRAPRGAVATRGSGGAPIRSQRPGAVRENPDRRPCRGRDRVRWPAIPFLLGDVTLEYDFQERHAGADAEAPRRICSPCPRPGDAHLRRGRDKTAVWRRDKVLVSSEQPPPLRRWLHELR